MTAILILRLQKNNLNCPAFFRSFNPIRRLLVARKTVYGLLEYKYPVIFGLVLGVICTLRSAVGGFILTIVSRGTNYVLTVGLILLMPFESAQNVDWSLD